MPRIETEQQFKDLIEKLEQIDTVEKTIIDELKALLKLKQKVGFEFTDREKKILRDARFRERILSQ